VLTDDHFFGNYNNLIFLQKKKTHLRKHKTHVDEEALLTDMSFPDSGPQIIFNQYDNYRNGSMFVSDWTRFIRFSYTYTQLTPGGV